MSNELLVETNHEVLRHLENCRACRTELAARRELRKRFSSAVRNAPALQINPAFAARLKADLRETALRPQWWEKFFNKKNLFNFRMLAAAVICLAFVGVIGLIRLKNSPSENNTAVQNEPAQTVENVPPSESPISQAVQAAWQEMKHLAVGDHKNCALVFRLKEKPITLQAAAEKYGKFYKNIDKAVTVPLKTAFTNSASDKIELIEAHSCVFAGQRFAHVILRYRNHKISVLVTADDLPDEGGTEIKSQANDAMQIAYFQTKHHLVFVVSDLSAAENLMIARIISPSVRQHIEKTEV